ncbi:MAG: hypothetical protein CTY16_09935 [Methylobacter sp.]|nr:MAG: hypothetical protein CTY16_09935 [Methylobacter sp.]
MSGYAALTRPTELGNPENEAQQELPAPHSQSVALELAEPSWKKATIGDIATVQSGVGFPKNYQGKAEDKYPVYKVGDVSRSVLNTRGLLAIAENSINEIEASKLKGVIFPEGTTLFAKIGEAVRLNRRAFVVKPGLADNNVMGVKPILKEMDKFIHYFMKTVDLNEASRSTTVPSIRKSDIEDLALGIPPLAEQQQIAAKLDELLAQVDTLKIRLDSIPKILKRFRQSVLTAAVSGKLTQDWRFEHRISDYSWQQVKVGQLVESIEAGKNIKCIETPPVGDQHGIIKISAVTWGTYNENESKTLSDIKMFAENRRIQSGDFLISRANTLELLGMPVIVKNVTKNLMLSDKVLRLVMNEADKKWLSIFFRSHFGRKEIESRSTGNQLSMRNIGQKALLDINLPKPIEEEQTEIVNRVEQLFTYADQIEQRVKDAQARVNHLTQAILAKAFRGELTADWREQNPDLISGENSAAALLAKIKAEREKIKIKKLK